MKESLFGPENITIKSREHRPLMLDRQERYGKGYVADERGFLNFDPSCEDKNYFKNKWQKEISNVAKRMNGYISILKDNTPEYSQTVSGLIQSLGRIPEPEEVEREIYRQNILRQAYQDEISIDAERMAAYRESEKNPQEEVIKKRAGDFPAPEKALKAFRDGRVRIVTEQGVTRLYITVPNKEGKEVDHPVMTDEETQWVNDSAEMIKRSVKDPNGKVFIAGLGLGLLNEKLDRLGVKNQVVAELNPGVIELVGSHLKREHTDLNLDIRQGDFKQVLKDAVAKGERFDAISIDAFPNTAEEVNRDASNDDVLSLAWQALKPGGKLTFYPDSRYIPQRILNVLTKRLHIPESAIHYTVSKFNVSDFTKRYHYGNLMSVPEIQKPVLNDADTLKEMKEEYFKKLEEKVKIILDQEIKFKKAA